ncbi:hypothetical protein BABINDRAFT_59317 [Babjeviella inositovora NRRL Y-12698]|uniref:ATP-dependent (S)-NAD(P)H-hydrate dehydratase n=1 Tax=Babjeviella inositovora NRRL Y-12698 TaxID=984486 RepID=A0A1E3QTC5_9ASCO|nr:uncharacterized protein BABINDRAFT_59317 [Babjeviella inositovora NRRL Y-12698]ODQ80908.1 hypothetical protein BABINDRAFT_59317 [Babjeviella inositovora NRRL Y-12698]
MSALQCKPSQLLQLAKATIIQPMLPHFHKGQAGRILIIGGSEDYTGAPFFLGHALMQMGCDLTHVVCDAVAGSTLKTYSPDLMIHPYLVSSASERVKGFKGVPKTDSEADLVVFLDDSPSDVKAFIDSHVTLRINSVVSRSINVTVVGPGLGRDPLVLYTAQKTLALILLSGNPVIIDADGLYLVSLKPSILTDALNSEQSNSQVVLTPNIMEFQRLCKAVNVSVDLEKLSSKDPEARDTYTTELATLASNRLHNVSLLVKGYHDIVVNGKTSMVLDHSKSVIPSLRRCGGQGDTLTGILATAMAWAANYQKGRLWDIYEHSHVVEGLIGRKKLTKDEGIILSCYLATLILRKSSSQAYAEKKRSMLASDVGKFIGSSYEDLVGE